MRATYIFASGDVRVVEEVGSEATTVKPGDFVISPLAISGGTPSRYRPVTGP